MPTSPDPSSSPCSSSLIVSPQSTEAEQQQRVTLIGKLLACYPARAEMELTLAAYLDDTADIALPWLIEGLRSFRDEPGRVFLPAISEVRTAVARSISKARMQALGREMPTGSQQKPPDVAAIIEWVWRKAPLGYAQLEQVIKAKQLRQGGGE